MWKDPIVEETRKLRESYAADHQHDIEAIFQDALKRQQSTSRKVVSLPPRKPTTRPSAA
tara:strand:- start:466 stop:642 length:177 start_codon:yes stop_codon:yes gene_type:complete